MYLDIHITFKKKEMILAQTETYILHIIDEIDTCTSIYIMFAQL